MTAAPVLTVADMAAARWVRGGRDPAGALDCLGWVLVALLRMGLPAEDPWRAIAKAWVGGRYVPEPPGGWRRVDPLPGAGELRAGDVLVSAAGHHVAVALGGGAVSSMGKGAGLVRVPAWRVLGAPGLEVWRRC